jgi:single-strand DNA-binding protein
MKDLDHVVLIGRLTKDAELKYTAGGSAVSKFSIAVNRRIKSGDQWKDEASFFEIDLWGKQAESLNQYLIKGKQIAITGELVQDRWTQDGQNRSKVYIKADDVQLLGGSGEKQAAPAYSATPREHTAPVQDDGFVDDIPF